MNAGNILDKPAGLAKTQRMIYSCFLLCGYLLITSWIQAAFSPSNAGDDASASKRHTDLGGALAAVQSLARTPATSKKRGRQLDQIP